VVEGTTSHKVYKREKGKFKHGENVLLGELLKGQLHFLQLKENLQKIRWSSPLQRMGIKA
jgi:hypothetical protein